LCCDAWYENVVHVCSLKHTAKRYLKPDVSVHIAVTEFYLKLESLNYCAGKAILFVRE
jgi:hypothetical protein